MSGDKLRFRSALEIDGPVPEHAIKSYEAVIDQLLEQRDELERLRTENEALKQDRDQLRGQLNVEKTSYASMCKVVEELKAERDRLQKQVDDFSAVRALDKRDDTSLGYGGGDD